MYLDLLFILNLAIDYFLLLVTAKLLHREAAFGRLLAGAALGGVAVLLLPFLLSPGPALVAVIVAAPLLMVLVVFWPLRWQEIIYYWGVFFLVSFMVAGAVTALLNFDPRRRFFASPYGILLLFAACLAIYLLFFLLRPFLEDKKWQKLWRMELQVAWQGKEKVVPAFLDTGNRLRDPFSSLPVIVIDYRSLEGLLPPPVYRHLAEEGAEPWSALEELADPALARCFTLIPCRSIGSESELLLGFKPDSVALFEKGRRRPLRSKVFLGLTRRGFGPAAEYRALLPPELLHVG